MPVPNPEPEPGPVSGPEQQAPDEHAVVVDWRLRKLEEAGYGLDLAQAIAGRVDIDLHRAVSLVRSGCSPSIAGRILL